MSLRARLVSDMKKPAKKDSVPRLQRPSTLAKARSYDLDLDPDNPQIRNSLPPFALHWVCLMLLFRRGARKDQILEALIYTHNGNMAKRDKHLRRLTRWEQLPAEHRNLIEDRFVVAALRRLIEMEALSEKEARANPEQFAATVTLMEPPFASIRHPIKVRDSGALYVLIYAAQLLAWIHGCTIERAIKACMTDSPPMAQMPDDMTIKAINHIMSKYRILLEAADISRSFERIPWAEARQEIKRELAPDVRAELLAETGIEYDEMPPADLFPAFCKRENACRESLTKAALSCARMFIHLKANAEGVGGSVLWHKMPVTLTLYELGFPGGHPRLEQPHE